MLCHLAWETLSNFKLLWIQELIVFIVLITDPSHLYIPDTHILLVFFNWLHHCSGAQGHRCVSCVHPLQLLYRKYSEISSLLVFPTFCWLFGEISTLIYYPFVLFSAPRTCVESTYRVQVSSGGFTSSQWNCTFDFCLVVLIFNSLLRWGEEADTVWPAVILDPQIPLPVTLPSSLAATSFHLLHILLICCGVWYWSLSPIKGSYFNFNPFSWKNRTCIPRCFPITVK